jgi:hypothetical protein
MLRRAPHARKVLKKQGLNLKRAEYKALCETGNFTVNERNAAHKDTLADGINLIRVSAGSKTVAFWVEVYKRKVIRVYAM